MRRFLLLAFLTFDAFAQRPGIWQSEAYGELLVVEPNRTAIYDITRTTCVLREEGPADYPAVEYPSPDRMVVSGNYYRYTLHRIDALPPQCTRTADVFDVFWETLNEHYAGFAVRGIDWQAVRAEWRPRVKPGMSQAEVYAILGNIVEEIDDPHLFVTNRKDLRYHARSRHGVARALSQARPGQPAAYYSRAARELTAGIEALVRYEILGGAFRTAFNDRLTWGMIDGDVGYLRASQFVGLFTGMTREQMYLALEAKLDEIFTDFSKAKSLIIDVSSNTGGAAFIPVAIARRVIREPRVAWTKRVRTPAGFSGDVYTLRIEPSPSVRFTGPVVVLMSNNSVSAGEELPLILQGLPHVTLAGERTPGALSDMQMKTLPDGGLLALPNEQLFGANGVNYDAIGIPPDVPMVVFEPRHPLSGFARTIAAAVQTVRAGAGLTCKPCEPPSSPERSGAATAAPCSSSCAAASSPLPAANGSGSAPAAPSTFRAAPASSSRPAAKSSSPRASSRSASSPTTPPAPGRSLSCASSIAASPNGS